MPQGTCPPCNQIYNPGKWKDITYHQKYDTKEKYQGKFIPGGDLGVAVGQDDKCTMGGSEAHYYR